MDPESNLGMLGIVRAKLEKYDALPANHQRKTIKCRECNDVGRVAIMVQRMQKVRGLVWSPVWFSCTCERRVEIYEPLDEAVEIWENPLRRPKRVVEYQNKIALLKDADVFVLEHAMNGTQLVNPLHAERPWSVWENLKSWAVPEYITQAWADAYEAGKSEQERVDEFFS